jgi:hypothetical protein
MGVGFGQGGPALEDDTTLGEFGNPEQAAMGLSAYLSTHGFTGYAGGYRSNMFPSLVLLAQSNPKQSFGQIRQNIIDGKALTAGETQEARTAGGVSGRIQGAINELARVGPQATAMIDKLGTQNFVPWNQVRANIARYSSDPRYAGFIQINQNLEANLRTLGAQRVGRSTEAERNALIQQLNEATGPDAYKAAVNAIIWEAWNTGQAFSEAMDPQGIRKNLAMPEPTPPSEYRPGDPVGQPRGQAGAAQTQGQQDASGFVAGRHYTDANGKGATYMGNGQWKPD